jgi:hypothetical protein
MRGVAVALFCVVAVFERRASALTLWPCRLHDDSIRRTVREHFPELRQCYASGLRDDPGLRGRVTIKFIIETDGSVGGTWDGGSDIGRASVVDCFAAVFKRMTFSRSDAKTTVVYPVALSPGGEGLSGVEIERVLRASSGRFQLCYADATRDDPSLSGSVRLRFVIEPDGRVEDLDVTTELPPRFAACVARATESIVFPPSEGEGVVRYKIHFLA